jgi:hypothetical protein
MHNLHIHAYEEVLPREVEGLLILEKTIKIILGGKFRLKATVAQDLVSAFFTNRSHRPVIDNINLFRIQFSLRRAH